MRPVITFLSPLLLPLCLFSSTFPVPSQCLTAAMDVADGRKFGMISCTPTSPPYGSVISGPGNCWDKSIGQTASTYKSCVKVWIDEDGVPTTSESSAHRKTDYRCTCNPVFPQKDEDCESVFLEAYVSPIGP